MPSAPALSEQELASTAPVERPKSVDNAFMLWLIMTGLGVLGLILTLTVGSDDITEQARKALADAGKSTAPADVDSAVKAAKTIIIVSGLLFSALYLLFAYMMRAGRNWARITLTVLGGIGIIGILLQLRQVGVVSMLFSLVQLVLIIAAVYLMFRPDGNRYFAAQKARR